VIVAKYVQAATSYCLYVLL